MISFLMCRRLFVSLFAAGLFLQPLSRAFGARASSCSVEPQDAGRVTETLKQMYVAATNDDIALFHRVTTTDFYAFDGGRRLSGDALMELIQSAHKAGKRYVWTVNEPDVRLACNDAWIAYTNRGSIQDASGTKDLTWLESAFLHKEAGAWKIQFFHSTRVP
jgi:Domain of unknown function (DUF4440)